MSYSVRLHRAVIKYLATLPKGLYERIKRVIAELAQEPRPTGCLKMSGAQRWRIRVGDYRIIYEIDDEARVVSIERVAHRRDVYR